MAKMYRCTQCDWKDNRRPWPDNKCPVCDSPIYFGDEEHNVNGY